MELKIIGRNRRVTLEKNQPLTRLVVTRLWSEGNSQIAHTESLAVWKGAFHDLSKGSEYSSCYHTGYPPRCGHSSGVHLQDTKLDPYPPHSTAPQGWSGG